MPDNYEYFYEGSHSSLEPGYGELFVGYRVPFREISMTTDARTANQLKEVSSKLSTGLKTLELSGASKEVFESIPKQHMKEINRVAKLTGSEMSVHAPIIDPAGFVEQQWGGEATREAVERQLWNVVEKSHELNPKGNVPVTFHSSAIGVGEYKKGVEGEKETMMLVDQHTGKVTATKMETEYYPGREKPALRTPLEGMEIMNATQWQDSLKSVMEESKAAEDRLNDAGKTIFSKIANNEPFGPEDQMARANLERAIIFAHHSYASLRTMYENAVKYGDENTKKIIKEDLKGFDKEFEEARVAERKGNPALFLQSINRLTSALHRIPAPQILKPVEDFAIEKAGKTFAELAFKGYKKWGDKAPLISIENPPVGMALSRGEELKELVKKSRDEFVKQAVKEGHSSDSAREAAKRLIGATWDIGHINMLRKYGYEKKDIIKETKKIAPYVKHMHLSDNFGLEHTELPMGMGNVPTKEIFEHMGKEGFKGKKVIEAIGWWQHFSEQGKFPPLPYTLEAFGSPIYPAMMQPYWNQARGTYGSYGGGFGMMLPEQHFSMYGAGFSTLPTELGGQIPGKKDRLSGTPME